MRRADTVLDLEMHSPSNSAYSMLARLALGDEWELWDSNETFAFWR